VYECVYCISGTTGTFITIIINNYQLLSVAILNISTIENIKDRWE